MKSLKFLWIPLMATFLMLPLPSHAQSLLEKVAVTILADRFGIDTSQVYVFQRQSQMSVYDMPPTYEAAYYFKRSPSTIRQLREAGLGWGEIAHRVGMQPGEFNKLRQQGAFDRDRFWENSCRDRFGASTQQIQVIRKSGGSLEDVLGAVLIGKLTKTNPQTIYNEYRDQRSWTVVTQSRNVRLEDWRRVSTPVRNRLPVRDEVKIVKSKSNKGVRDHGKGIGKGNSKSNGKALGSQDHFNQKSKGKDKDNRKGNGKSKGKNRKG